MPPNKIKNFFNSFRNKLLIIISLLVIAGVLLLTKFFLLDKGSDTPGTNTENTDKQVKADLNTLRNSLDGNVDSILYSFGIKKEWITTSINKEGDKTISKGPDKHPLWFAKSVLIPGDLSSIEVNLDLSSYINSVGLTVLTTEDIFTKDITLLVSNGDTVKSNQQLAKISIIHSDKVIRESALFCIILNNTGEYSREDIDKLVIHKSEFSFVFPRNLDDIDIQSRLMQNKKDVLINLTVGGKDNYEADFNSTNEEKTIRDKVINFSKDFPTIANIILTKAEPDVPQQTMNLISTEFSKFNIKVIKDSALTKLLTAAEEESKGKISALFSNLKTKAALARNLITLVKIEPDEFDEFYNNILVMKKLGYKFCNYGEYAQKSAEMEKLQKQKEEKLKLELDKKKKQPEKKQPEKKTPENKSGDKKKTETKKKTDDKKKK